ncbi:MAG: tetratricopeptide repeat protein, partial [Polyangia bacterium]
LLDAVARQQRAQAQAAQRPTPAAPPKAASSPTVPVSVRAPAGDFFASSVVPDSGPIIEDPSIESEIRLADVESENQSATSIGGVPGPDDEPTGFEDDAPTSVATAAEIVSTPRRAPEQRPEAPRVTTLPARTPARVQVPVVPPVEPRVPEPVPQRSPDRVTTLPQRADARPRPVPAPQPAPRQPERPRRIEPIPEAPLRPQRRGPVDLRATARELLGDIAAEDSQAHSVDEMPSPVPDEMTRAWDARRSRAFVWLWVALVLLSGGIAGGYIYRARERARLLAIAVARADDRVLEATADGDFAARDAYAGALRSEPKMRKYAAMVALAAARLAADQGEDTEAAGWAMIKRAEREAQRQKASTSDVRTEHDLRQARALLALARGESCPPLIEAEDGDIAARCALQRGDTDSARKILSDTLKLTGDNKNARALLALANLELGAGDLDAADAAFGKILAAYPNHPRAVVGRLMVAIERGESPTIPDVSTMTVRLGQSTQAWFHLARGLVLLGKPNSTDAASAELDLARRGILHDGRLALLYGRARLLEGKVAEAEQAMRVAERLNPNDADVAVLDAEVALAKGYEEKVVAALSVGAQTPRKLAVLGRAQALTGRYKEAAATLDAALTKRPGDAVSITYRAIARSHLGDAAGAQKELEKAATQPGASTAHYGLGLLAFDRRDLARARVELEKSLASQNAEAFRARALLGRVLRDLGKTKEALTELQRVAHEAPALVPVHASLGRLYLDLGRDREARAELRQVLDGGSPTADDKLVYAESLVHLGIVDQADKAIEDAAAAGVPIARMADLKLELSSWRGAKEAGIAARTFEKEHKGARNAKTALTLADMYRRAGELKRAGEVYREALVGDPLRANLGIGRVQLLSGDTTGAESSFRAALELVTKPSDTIAPSVDDEVDARIGLARALLSRKAAGEAQQDLEIAVDKDPKSAEAEYFLARAYQDKNDLDKARTAAEQAVTLDDTYADAFALVGDLQRGPKPDRAKAAYKKYLELAPDGEHAHLVKKNLAALK